MTPTPAPRPDYLRCSCYVPRAPADDFIIPLLRERIERCLADLTKAGTGRALDVGCGRQPFRGAIESAGLSYHSVDAVQNPEGSVGHIAAVDGELPAALLAAGPFDLVLCTEVMEHVADWPAAFANLRRLTAAGGRLVITCPHFFMMHEEPYDFWRPTDHALRYFAGRSGFRVVALERLGGPREVLGTLLSFCTFKPRRPGPFRYVVARGLNVIKRVALRYLHSRLAKSGPAELTGPTYLSNFAVLAADDPDGRES